ncbi:MAG: HD domain-containing protein [Saprospiraceae bacterium]|nr:HD domain-containing protein [Saprospiraceae bacterium]
MSKRKIINDPIYGLITFPDEIIYDFIDHSFFQRLRRISQMGLSTYVYPGANHSRFSHALGALHLMTTALDILKSKDVNITGDEYTGACLAILLHDIGHGPFSHALEHVLVEKDHETISLDIMHALNNEFKGKLNTAISIFKGSYPKKFLTQLVSSQLDMDRMDYLTRDSYYSGVAEGVIGYKRIVSMLNVADDELVVEEKGIFSIEKFIVARYIMYWQVYLHKTSLASEQMLKSFVLRFKYLVKENPEFIEECRLKTYFDNINKGKINKENYLEHFLTLDDIDIYTSLKINRISSDPIIKILSNGILDRRLFKVIIENSPLNSDLIESIRQKVAIKYKLDDQTVDQLLIQGQESSKAYDNIHEEIKILSKNGTVEPISGHLDVLVNVQQITKYYICYPC